MFNEIRKQTGTQAQLAATVRNQTLELKQGNIYAKQNQTAMQGWMKENFSWYKKMTAVQEKGMKGFVKDIFSGQGIMTGLGKAISKFGLLGEWSDKLSDLTDTYKEYVAKEQAEREEKQLALIDNLVRVQKESKDEIRKILMENGATAEQANKLMEKAQKGIENQYQTIVQEMVAEGKSTKQIIARLRGEGLLASKGKSEYGEDEYYGGGGQSGLTGKQRKQLTQAQSELGKVPDEQWKKLAEEGLKNFYGAAEWEKMGGAEQQQKLTEAVEGMKEEFANTQGAESEYFGERPEGLPQVEGVSSEILQDIADELEKSGEQLVDISDSTKETRVKTKHIAAVLDKYTGISMDDTLRRARQDAIMRTKQGRKDEKEEGFFDKFGRVLDFIPGGKFLKGKLGKLKGIGTAGLNMMKNLLPAMGGTLMPVIGTILAGAAIGGLIGTGIDAIFKKFKLFGYSEDKVETKMTDYQKAEAKKRGYTGPDSDVEFNKWLQEKSKAKMAGTQTGAIPEMEKKKIEAQTRQAKSLEEYTKAAAENAGNNSRAMADRSAQIIPSVQNAVDKIPSGDLAAVAKGAGR
jgi:hypothetical protein